ncbi:hypothetical protein DFH27DRAFT_637118 [Peziza echinospora]|nr:hypothetical protein DFH27DRAFT_637118 [Peziza echinospora]
MDARQFHNGNSRGNLSYLLEPMKAMSLVADARPVSVPVPNIPSNSGCKLDGRQTEVVKLDGCQTLVFKWTAVKLRLANLTAVKLRLSNLTAVKLRLFNSSRQTPVLNLTAVKLDGRQTEVVKLDGRQTEVSKLDCRQTPVVKHRASQSTAVKLRLSNSIYMLWPRQLRAPAMDAVTLMHLLQTRSLITLATPATARFRVQSQYACEGGAVTLIRAGHSTLATPVTARLRRRSQHACAGGAVTLNRAGYSMLATTGDYPQPVPATARFRTPVKARFGDGGLPSTACSHVAQLPFVDLNTSGRGQLP